MTQLTLTYCTNYNGVCLNLTDDDTKPTNEMNVVFDEVADTLPEFTYKWAKDDWDHMLSDKQIKKLIKKAAKIVRDVFPNADIEFEYDTTST